MKLLSIAECLARLPIKMAARKFRQKVRASGHYMEHRGQLMLTEADLELVLEELRPCSKSRAGKAAKRFGSRVPSTASASAKALELISATPSAFGAPERKLRNHPKRLK